MSTETTNKKIKIDNGTTFGRTYTDKAIDERLQGLVSTATFTPVKEKANNSLQKPSGLTKTELVGVGTNGQENIEIGDNLTLANGKLSATGGGSGGGSDVNVLQMNDEMTSYSGTLDSSKLNVFKNSKLCLSSTKTETQTYEGQNLTGAFINYLEDERDGVHAKFYVAYDGTISLSAEYILQRSLYIHHIQVTAEGMNVIFDIYDGTSSEYKKNTLINALATQNREHTCSGYVNDQGTFNIARDVGGSKQGNLHLKISSFNPSDGSTISTDFADFTINDNVKIVY